jgi:hypothetical protein
MSGLGSSSRALAVFLVAAGLVACGGTIYFRGSGPSPTPQPRIAAIEPAPPLPAGTDAIIALSQRPMRLPVLAPNASCPVSSSGGTGLNSGLGVGPVYLSGGLGSWYSGGQEVDLMVDSKYSGPLLVRSSQLGSDGKAKVTFADFPALMRDEMVAKWRQHGVLVVSAVHATGGGLYLPAVISSSFWRAWEGSLSTDGPGCFALQVDGDLFTEFIVISVQAGAQRPPGP